MLDSHVWLAQNTKRRVNNKKVAQQPHGLDIQYQKWYNLNKWTDISACEKEIYCYGIISFY